MHVAGVEKASYSEPVIFSFFFWLVSFRDDFLKASDNTTTCVIGFPICTILVNSRVLIGNYS